jgi:hypothetical protein
VADTEPAPARDGRIAYVSTRLGNPEIFVLGPSGTVRVTNNASGRQAQLEPDEAPPRFQLERAMTTATSTSLMRRLQTSSDLT